jgi:uncharacterized protein (DUF2141 family)
MTYIRKITALILLLMGNSTGFAQILELSISNIRSHNGQLCIALFDSEEGFRKEQPCWEKIYSKCQLQQGELVLTIRIPSGIYGLSVLDDENMDGNMNYNRIRVPLEGFGFSNYKHKGIRKPKFKQFTFNAKEDEKVKVEVKMRYF